MNLCILLAAASLACPWTRSSARTYYWCEPMPVYVTCQPMPSCTYPSTMVCDPVVAEVAEEAKSLENASAEETDEQALENASLEEAEDDEITTAFVDYGSPVPYAGGDLALDWGVASIGAGTLYPTDPYTVGGGGFYGGFGPNNNNGDPGEVFFPGITNTSVFNNYNNVFVTNPGPGPGPQPVPEPSSVAVWGIGIAGLAYWVRRRRAKRNS